MNRLQSAVVSDWFGPAMVSLIAVVGIGALNPTFLSPLNLNVLLLAVSINALIAMSQMIIIAIGQMNLAVGAIGGFAAVSFAGLMEVWNVPPPLAAAAALAIGLGAGFLNGWIIASTGISAFVITLASLAIFKGFNLGITRAQPFYAIADSVKAFGTATFFGVVPWLLLPTLAVAVLLWYLLARLPLGRNILAVGANPNASAL